MELIYSETFITWGTFEGTIKNKTTLSLCLVALLFHRRRNVLRALNIRERKIRIVP